MSSSMSGSTIGMGGAIMVWSLARYTSRENLLSLWRPLGLEGIVPQPVTGYVALREALYECFAEPCYLIRPLKGVSGFTVKREVKGQEDNDVATACVAKLTDQGNITINPYDQALAAKLAGAYQVHKGYLPSEKISESLTRLVENSRGISLRQKGGVYWLPEDSLPSVLAASKGVEQAAAKAGRSGVYFFRHRLDPDSVRGVKDNLVREIGDRVREISKDVTSGQLGERALRMRESLAVDLEQMLSQYEEILDCGLANVRQQVEAVRIAATQAALEASVAAATAA